MELTINEAVRSCCWRGIAECDCLLVNFDESKHPRATDGKFGSGGGGKKSPRAKPPAKIDAAPDKVAALTARLAEARATVKTLAAELKAAKADAAKVKEAVKVASTKKGATKADLLAKDTAAKLQAMSDGWVKLALEAPALDKKGYSGHDYSKVPNVAAQEAAVKEAMGKASAHKVAKEIGLTSKFKNSAEAFVAIQRRLTRRSGSIARVDA